MIENFRNRGEAWYALRFTVLVSGVLSIQLWSILRHDTIVVAIALVFVRFGLARQFEEKLLDYRLLYQAIKVHRKHDGFYAKMSLRVLDLLIIFLVSGNVVLL